jgi:PilZ domain
MWPCNAASGRNRLSRHAARQGIARPRLLGGGSLGRFLTRPPQVCLSAWVSYPLDVTMGKSLQLPGEVMSEDILPFPGSRPAPPPAQDRRLCVRFPCNEKTLFQASAPHSYVLWWATVHNVSATGIGLLLRHEVVIGTELIVEVPIEINQPLRLLRARVARVMAQDNGAWMAGCEFVQPLSATESEALAGLR